jgi:outer membrane protein assembly factor BamD
LISCSDYSKIVKGDNYQLKYETANSLYDKQSFSKAIILFEQIYQHSPRSGEGELAYYRLAQCYFQLEDYYMAEYYFQSYLSRFPYSTNKEKVYFSKVLCSVRNSPNYELDQSETNKAINDVQDFINRFPNSQRIDTCNVLIDNLRFKLEKKDFEEVYLYAKTEKYRAAVTSAEIFTSKYPKSIFLEEAHYIMVKNSFLLAINSIESKKEERIGQSNERFLNFAEQFSNSKYLNELKVLRNKLN